MEPPRGLDDAEAARRLAQLGPNALPAPRGRGLIRFVLEVLEEPIFALLLGAAALYAAIGDTAEGLLLAGCAGVSVALVAVQSWRSERVLTALKGVTAPRARVVRAGVARRIPTMEIVPGDIVVLAAGDRVPADGLVRQGAGLVIDESALTGESIPVRKRAALAGDAAPATATMAPGGDDTPWVFSGTLILAGEGLAEIQATGPRSRIGAIGTALATLRWPSTPLQDAMGRLVRRLALLALTLSAVLALMHAARYGDWLAAALAGITLAMSAIPEELPMVLAIFLAVGGWRLSRHGVLARQPSAVLALGATTVLCVDKTGTITENVIRLERVAVPDAMTAPDMARGDPRFATLCATAPRAAHPQGGDPMDRATLTLGAPTGEAPLHEYPLTPERPRVAFAWRVPDGMLVAAKGAPESIARLCNLDPSATAAMQDQVRALAAEGLRVLAVASVHVPVSAPPEDIEDLGFGYLGLLGFGDPVRDSARGSVAECHAAGMEVVMITGDHPATATAIAHRAGIDGTGHAITGRDLATLDRHALEAAIVGKRVFARTEPGQKLRIVEALQARGHVVAMTGDGVNDAPALRAAHVGVAMGSRGTDVAREAAGLVVLNDDLGSIVAAIALGRRIADNLRKAMVFIVAVHIPLVGLAMLPLLFGWPPMLNPVHVIFLELFIDPTCAIVFESQREEPGAMRRPPRSARHAVVSPLTVAMGVLQGSTLLVVVAGIYGWSLQSGQGAEIARTLAFVALVAGTLGLALTNLSWGRSAASPAVLTHPAFAVAAGATAAILAVLLFWPMARAMFGFALPEAGPLALAAMAGLASALWFEAVKASGLLARRG
jgi:Ca2+-transporting ATPase